jgi:hypothetical protein
MTFQDRCDDVKSSQADDWNALENDTANFQIIDFSKINSDANLSSESFMLGTWTMP